MAERNKGPRYYRTVKPARQSVAEILALLSEYGAESFHVQQTEGRPTAIAFVFNGLAFRLEPEFDGLEARLRADGVRGYVKDVEAVAWKQMRELLELQLETVASGLMRPAAMFGGYALTSAGRTVGAMIEERHRELMPGETPLLPGPREA